MKLSRIKTGLLLLIIVVTLVGVGLRAYAAKTLYIDYDEPIYLEAALEYTNYIRDGQANWIIWTETNFEHPSFYKVIYSLVLLTRTPLEILWDKDFVDLTPMTESPAYEWGMAGRWTSVFIGSLAVLALALVNPLAGLFLGINSLGIKYTSMFYLEALPLLMSFLSVLAYGAFYKTLRETPQKKKRAFLWLAASALCLGITAASKYLYCTAGLAIGLHWLISVARKQIPARSLWMLLGWGIASVAVFFVCDFYLWPHPISRLLKTLLYHSAYPQNENVAEYGYPVWQPVLWLLNPFKYFDPMTPASFPVYLDPLIFALAIIGIPRTFTKKNLYFIWFAIGLAVLLFWGTKWPQYVLILLIPYSMMAAQGTLQLFELGKLCWNKWVKKKSIQPG